MAPLQRSLSTASTLVNADVVPSLATKPYSQLPPYKRDHYPPDWKLPGGCDAQAHVAAPTRPSSPRPIEQQFIGLRGYNPVRQTCKPELFTITTAPNLRTSFSRAQRQQDLLDGTIMSSSCPITARNSVRSSRSSSVASVSSSSTDSSPVTYESADQVAERRLQRAMAEMSAAKRLRDKEDRARFETHQHVLKLRNRAAGAKGWI